MPRTGALTAAMLLTCTQIYNKLSRYPVESASMLRGGLSGLTPCLVCLLLPQGSNGGNSNPLG